MGGKTPTRLVDSCSMYLEADETAIYEAWVRGNKTVIWYNDFIISEINDYYSKGNKVVVEKNSNERKSEDQISNSSDVVIKIKEVLGYFDLIFDSKL